MMAEWYIANDLFGKRGNVMKKMKSVTLCAIVFLLQTAASVAQGENNKQISISSMMGAYEGMIQVDKPDPIGHLYTVEILSIDKATNTLSMVAYCTDCSVKELKRDYCDITDVKEVVKFRCKLTNRFEEYIFDGDRLTGTGFGFKYPYSISVGKIDD